MKNQSNEETKQPTKEKIVPLHEDMNSHKHDDASFEKVLRQQEEARKNLEKSRQ